MNWHLAPSLVQLRAEITAGWPGRSTVSDGSIGDPAHSARVSDHNPDADGWVRAVDVTQWDPHTPNDPSDDVAQALAEHLRSQRDPRIKYVIWRGRMFSSYATATRAAWAWGPYSGPNGHFHHVHVSVVAGPAGLDARSWSIHHQEHDTMTPEQEAKLDRAIAALARLEQRLTRTEALAGAARGEAAAAGLRAQAIQETLANERG